MSQNYLKRYKDVYVYINELYRDIDRLDESVRQKVQQISVDHTRTIVGSKIGIVFYDVTTLYFESATEDVLRACGFSKDEKVSYATFNFRVFI